MGPNFRTYFLCKFWYIPIVIGVSIDDTVHFLWAWREAEQRGMGWDDALVYTYDHAGRPAVITTILLVAGYAVLMAGSGATVFYFGLLTTVAASLSIGGVRSRSGI